MIKRLINTYCYIANVFLSTFLLIATTAVILSFIFSNQDFFWSINSGGHKFSDSLVPKHYYYTEASERDALFSEMDQWGISGFWQSSPWTMLLPRPFKSTQINIDVNGQRLSVSPSTEHSRLPKLIVWAFGGSTMFGWGVSDKHTVASYLQVALQKKFTDRQVVVKNYGAPYYNSSHEASLYLAELRKHRDPPNIVVFLDGLNDGHHALYSGSDSPLEQIVEPIWEKWLASLNSPPPWISLSANFPILRGLRHYKPTSEITWKLAAKTEHSELLESAVFRYHTNVRSLYSICKEFKVAPYFFLQPIPMTLSADRKSIADPFYKLMSQSLAGKLREIPYFDLSTIFRNTNMEYSLSVEQNGTHYTDYASKILAEQMADIIIQGYSAN